MWYCTDCVVEKEVVACFCFVSCRENVVVKIVPLVVVMYQYVLDFCLIVCKCWCNGKSSKHDLIWIFEEKLWRGRREELSWCCQGSSKWMSMTLQIKLQVCYYLLLIGEEWKAVKMSQGGQLSKKRLAMTKCVLLFPLSGEKKSPNEEISWIGIIV